MKARKRVHAEQQAKRENSCGEQSYRKPSPDSTHRKSACSFVASTHACKRGDPDNRQALQNARCIPNHHGDYHQTEPYVPTDPESDDCEKQSRVRDGSEQRRYVQHGRAD